VTSSTFVDLRHTLGFGIVRLKLLLAIRREPGLDTPGWSGRFIADIGPHGQVKAALEPAKREVTLEDPMNAERRHNGDRGSS